MIELPEAMGDQTAEVWWDHMMGLAEALGNQVARDQMMAVDEDAQMMELYGAVADKAAVFNYRGRKGEFGSRAVHRAVMEVGWKA